MAKTRLNQERRFALCQHAKRFCSELKLDAQENQEIEDSIKRRDAAFAKMSTMAHAAAATFYPKADLDVLRKYGLTKHVDSAVFMNLDNQSETFEIEFIDEDAFCRGIDTLQRDEQDKLREEFAAEKEKRTLEVPINGYTVDQHGWRQRLDTRPIPCGPVLVTLHKDWKAACTDEKDAADALREKRYKLLDSLETLIKQARHYEDVVDVWPYAAAIRERIIPPQTALSVLSDDALNAIREAQRFHDETVGTTPAIEAPSNQKALPAPHGEIIDVIPTDVTDIASQMVVTD